MRGDQSTQIGHFRRVALKRQALNRTCRQRVNSAAAAMDSMKNNNVLFIKGAV